MKNIVLTLILLLTISACGSPQPTTETPGDNPPPITFNRLDGADLSALKDDTCILSFRNRRFTWKLGKGLPGMLGEFHTVQFPKGTRVLKGRWFLADQPGHHGNGKFRPSHNVNKDGTAILSLVIDKVNHRVFNYKISAKISPAGPLRIDFADSQFKLLDMGR